MIVYFEIEEKNSFKEILFNLDNLIRMVLTEMVLNFKVSIKIDLFYIFSKATRIYLMTKRRLNEQLERIHGMSILQMINTKNLLKY